MENIIVVVIISFVTAAVVASYIRALSGKKPSCPGCDGCKDTLCEKSVHQLK